MRNILFVLAFFTTIGASAQENGGADDWQHLYRAFATKSNDLVHTKLDATFDYQRSYLNGKVWITLEPHFYATDSLVLDAKGMDIEKLSLFRAGKYLPLDYRYDSLQLHIKLDKTYRKCEKYIVYIAYTAKPNEFKTEGSAAITDAKGLYFINPTGAEKDKPTQIWTQGETEANSVWIPTIDKPNQKTTQEFALTVPARYVTLSNGKLMSQKKNKDGTRTDTWVMTQRHSPYLFFMGVGDYAVIKDSYKGKEVSYYVEKPYAKVARKIFGNTPEMIRFFSDKVTGIDYPWPKYSQIVGRDYVSGAMENTTATLHQESAQQNARELVDGNSWESTIAHELFHQWFGDLVTAESWSNLTVNESFADYSQYLWLEHKYGADEAGYENATEMATYLSDSASRMKDLVRFYYKDKEDMFDLVSYQKGGRILNMLRHYVGDDAFFKSLNKYLTTYQYGNGNAHKLRLAFEEVTGKDLNWFFNQWYFGNSNPTLDISYAYDAPTRKASVYVKQIQKDDKLFRLPLTIDIHIGDRKETHQVWASNRVDTFAFTVSSKPDLMEVDPARMILAIRKDHKTLPEYIFQYKSGSYLERKEAVEYAAEHSTEPGAMELLVKALDDPYFRIRITALEQLQDLQADDAAISKIVTIAKKDDHRLTRAAAIDVLAKQKNESYQDFFVKGTTDSSYAVAGASLEALAVIDSTRAFDLAKKMQQDDNRGRLLAAITNVMILYGDETAFDYVTHNFEEMVLSREKLEAMFPLVRFLAKVTDPEKFRKGVDMLVKFRDEIPQAYRSSTDPYINGLALTALANKKASMGAKEMADYVKSKIPADK
jgi:aminopeptidase N